MEHRTDPAQVEHPTWCVKGNMCREDGIHHSRPLTVVTGDVLRLWLERSWTVDRVSVVMETTTDGEVSYAYLTVGQARALRHQLGRLLDASKGGQR